MRNNTNRGFSRGYGRGSHQRRSGGAPIRGQRGNKRSRRAPPPGIGQINQIQRSSQPHSPHTHSPHAHSPHAHSPHAHSPHAHSPHAHSPRAHSPHAHSPHTTGKNKAFTSPHPPKSSLRTAVSPVPPFHPHPKVPRGGRGTRRPYGGQRGGGRGRFRGGRGRGNHRGGRGKYDWSGAYRKQDDQPFLLATFTEDPWERMEINMRRRQASTPNQQQNKKQKKKRPPPPVSSTVADISFDDDDDDDMQVPVKTEVQQNLVKSPLKTPTNPQLQNRNQSSPRMATLPAAAPSGPDISFGDDDDSVPKSQTERTEKPPTSGVTSDSFGGEVQTKDGGETQTDLDTSGDSMYDILKSSDM